MTFKFSCFACRAVLQAKTYLCGRSLACPKCGASLVVPDYAPPVAASTSPAPLVNHPSFSITVDDEPISSRRYRKSSGNWASTGLSIAGAAGMILITWFFCSNVKNGSQLDTLIRYILFGSYAAAFLFPIILALQGYLKPSRWVIIGVALFVLSATAFASSIIFTASMIQFEGSDLSRKSAPVAEWSVRFFVWFFLLGVGSLFGAGLHRTPNRKSVR